MIKNKLIRGAYAVFYILIAFLSADDNQVFYSYPNLAKDGFLRYMGEYNE